MSASPSQIARRWFDEVWNKRNEDVIYELMAEDGVGHTANGPITGPAAFHSMWKGFIALLPDLRLEVEDVIKQEDNVVIRWRMVGRHEGNAFGLMASGAAITQRGITWLKCRDGKMVEGWDCWNEGGLFAQLQAACAALPGR
jgi:steroid delta-isomerase-like uncharacterized protein